MGIAEVPRVLPDSNMEFPEKLRRLMKTRRLSQTQLARMVGRHQTTVGAWCRGLNSPTLEDGRLLAEILGVPLEYLADDGADDPKPPEFSAEERQLIRDARVIGIVEARRRMLLAPPPPPDRDPPFVGVATIERPALSRSGEPLEQTGPQAGPATSSPETRDAPAKRKGLKSGNQRR